MAAQSSDVRPSRSRLGLIPRHKLHYGSGMVEENVRMGDCNERYGSRDLGAADSDRRWLGTFLSEFIRAFSPLGLGIGARFSSAIRSMHDHDVWEQTYSVFVLPILRRWKLPANTIAAAYGAGWDFDS